MHCEQRVGHSTSIIYRRMKTFLKIKLKPYDLSASEMILLLQMVDEDGSNQEALRDGLQYDKAVVARLVKKLIDKGYLRKISNQQDKRAYELFRTQKAKDFEPTIFRLLGEWNTVLSGAEDLEKIETMRHDLMKMAQRAVEKVEELQNGQE